MIFKSCSIRRFAVSAVVTVSVMIYVNAMISMIPVNAMISTIPVSTMISVYTEDPNASYENLVTMGDIVHDRYNDSEVAERIYRRGISLEPQEPGAYYGLAATLQAQGDERGALKLVEDYIERYGQAEEMVEAQQILQNALEE